MGSHVRHWAVVQSTEDGHKKWPKAPDKLTLDLWRYEFSILWTTKGQNQAFIVGSFFMCTFLKNKFTLLPEIHIFGYILHDLLIAGEDMFSHYLAPLSASSSSPWAHFLEISIYILFYSGSNPAQATLSVNRMWRKTRGCLVFSVLCWGK